MEAVDIVWLDAGQVDEVESAVLGEFAGGFLCYSCGSAFNDPQ